MIGQEVLHYRITEKLGEGGMGVVYKAEDTKLHRTVALKFLSAHAVENTDEQKRLVNEARAAAGLQHPNICTVYEINEFKGQTFIAMAYVEGVTLRDKVLSGTVGIDEALDILSQVAEGLEQAHKNDIVHRDIKSANIMVTETGRALVMDFGLAKSAQQVKPEDAFSSGGTSAYMSPEQARGEAIDRRTDVWSLGIVLYEMLAGQLPFRGDYVQAVVYSILNEEPKDLKSLRPDVPDGVAAIVRRCMEKDPASRYATVGELIEALRGARASIAKKRKRGRAGVESTGSSRRSRAVSIPLAAVAVLIGALLVYQFLSGGEAGGEERIPIAVIDFKNETGERALDGLSGMLITSLEQSRRLSVMTRSRMFDLLKVIGRGNVARIDESIGQELCRKAGVDALVIPTIRKFGDLYTIDLKVLDTRQNSYIFTTKEEGRGEESIPTMIDKIARNIRIDLKEKTALVQAHTKSVADVTTVSMDAYQRYFEGEQKLNELDFEAAGKAFEDAVALDSTFALAMYRHAYTDWWHRKTDKAQKSLQKAVAMMDRLPEKERFLARALEAGLENGFAAQIPIFRKMEALYPGDKEMLFGLADAEFHSEMYDSAQVRFERLLEIDPTFERALQHLTWTYARTDQLEKAQKIAQKWADVTGSPEAYQELGNLYFLAGDIESAMAQFEKARAHAHNKAHGTLRLAAMHLLSGDHEKCISEIRLITEGDYTEEEKTVAYWALVGGVYPYLGQFDRAMASVNTLIGALSSIATPDTSIIVNLLMGKASIAYWERENMESAREIIEKTFAYADRHKNMDYWLALAAFEVMEDTAAAKRTLREHVPIKILRDVYDVVIESWAGNCDGAKAILETAFALKPGGETTLPQEAYGSVFYGLARCQFEQRQYEDAIANLEKVLELRRFTFNSALVVPKSYYLLGKAYEAIGDGQAAKKSYNRLLELWKNADGDLPELIESKARVAALTAAGSM